MEQYTHLAQVYDDMIDMEYDKWMEFLKEYFKGKDINLKGKKALELGCGTGNMTFRLKENGIDVTAVDISRDMLTIAEEKARNKRLKIMFLNQDMTKINTGKEYDFVFSFCDGYNYILTEEKLEKSFKGVYKHLKPGGYFIFDISTSHKLKNIMGNNTFTMNRDELCYIWDNYLEDDILEMYITFFVKEGVLYRRFDEKHEQKIYDLNNLKQILIETGFKNVEVYEDYSFESVKENSIRGTFIAYKEE
ncbi:S-adenosylmethionine-dependent methyltransferase [Fervidicella metallireducens AeB]|uniref:S-adenosylmethionine-dependent methyltransferase n=1 Tax=Fervidicella metallireducens AeB TaxID=1403537 RepID=A0A017RXB9_9CLOT|nr:class I SAM-dependent methyltransferase [Fervidicella metallireducens]EYE89428.1 S-adenosylmethionine-dependent methyltransferase [Fervidicella metallireducens AeB]